MENLITKILGATSYKTHFVDFTRLIQSLILLMGILFFNSCSEVRQNANQEINIVERIGEDVAFYKFHFEYGVKSITPS